MPEVPVAYVNITARIQLAGDLEPMSTSIGAHLIDPDTFDQADANSIAGTMGTFVKGVMTSDYSVINVNCFAGTSAGDVSFDSATGNGAGAIVAAPVPQNTAYLIRKSGALAGRKHRGRMFIPGVRESVVEAVGSLTTGEQSRITALVDAFFFTRTTSAVYDSFEILHSYGDATIPTPITAMRIDPVVATQRRRLRR